MYFNFNRGHFNACLRKRGDERNYNINYNINTYVSIHTMLSIFLFLLTVYANTFFFLLDEVFFMSVLW